MRELTLQPGWRRIERTFYPVEFTVRPPWWKIWAKPEVVLRTVRFSGLVTGEGDPVIKMNRYGFLSVQTPGAAVYIAEPQLILDRK